MSSQHLAKEVDRIVLDLGRITVSRRGPDALEAGRDVGLHDLAMLPPIADFLTGPGISRDMAKLRFRYAPAAAIDARFDGLIAEGLVDERSGVWRASDRLRPVLAVVLEAVVEVSGGLWAGHEETVARASAMAQRVIDATDDTHTVAVAHRELADPEAAGPRLDKRLRTLRYIRQHDHAEAWLQRDVTAAEMVILTALWLGNDVPAADESAIARLTDRGWVDADRGLTPAGKAARDDIEAETNERNDVDFAVLGADADELLAVLQRLPVDG